MAIENNLIKDVLVLMAGYAMIAVASITAMQALSKGFLFKLISTRMGRGRKVLLRVDTVTDPYFVVAKLRGDGMLEYKKRGGKRGDPKKLVMIERGAAIRIFGALYAECEEQGSAVRMQADYSVVPGHDSERTDSLITRTAMLPKMPGSKEIIVIIMLILILVLCGYMAYKQGKIEGLLATLNTVAPAAPVVQ